MNRQDFNLLNRIVYLDNAAGTLKPKQAIKKLEDFYNNFSINMHSIDSKIGQEVKQEVDSVRQKTANLLNTDSKNIVFTSGTTDSLNRIALAYENELKTGDKVVLSPFNHASANLPWIEIAKKMKIELVYSKSIIDDIDSKTKVIVYAEINNTLEFSLDVDAIYKKAKEVGAIVINDAAQAVAHKNVSLDYCDVIAFSTNKIYGPTGLGVLAIKDEYLNSLTPRYVGGGTNTKITTNDWVKKDNFLAWEAGTLNTAGIFMFGATLDYLNNVGMENIHKHEKEVAEYMFDKFAELKDVKVYSKKGDTNLVFNIANYNPQDITSYLGHKDIIIRGGRNCVGMLEQVLGVRSLCRVSLAMYNSKEDIDKLVSAIKDGGDFLDFI